MCKQASKTTSKHESKEARKQGSKKARKQESKKYCVKWRVEQKQKQEGKEA
jgi:hypothetical protein